MPRISSGITKKQKYLKKPSEAKRIQQRNQIPHEFALISSPKHLHV